MGSPSRIRDEPDLRTGPLTRPRTRGNYRALLLIWTVFLLTVVLFGWHKSTENERDRVAHAAWREKINRLQTESQAEWNRVSAELDQLRERPDARQSAAEWLRGHLWKRTHEGANQPIENWIHSTIGIRLQLFYNGDRITGHSLRHGTTALTAIHPQPVWRSRYSQAEKVRQFVIAWMPYVWVLALLVAVLFPYLRALAAHMMLALALLCGTAWLVAPHYSLTLRGVLSNDSLFFAVVMLLVSIAAVAHVAAAAATQRGHVLRFRFRLSTLLVLMGVIAGFLAIRPFGVVAISVLAVGGVLFWLSWHFFSAAGVSQTIES